MTAHKLVCAAMLGSDLMGCLQAWPAAADFAMTSESYHQMAGLEPSSICSTDRCKIPQQQQPHAQHPCQLLCCKAGLCAKAKVANSTMAQCDIDGTDPDQCTLAV